MEIPAKAAVQFLAVGQGFDVQVPLKGDGQAHYIHVGQIRGHVPLIVNQKDADTTNGEGEAVGQIIRSFLVVVAPDDS